MGEKQCHSTNNSHLGKLYLSKFPILPGFLFLFTFILEQYSIWVVPLATGYAWQSMVPDYHCGLDCSLVCCFYCLLHHHRYRFQNRRNHRIHRLLESNPLNFVAERLVPVFQLVHALWCCLIVNLLLFVSTT